MGRWRRKLQSVLATLVGFLVFLIGISVCFESIGLGLAFVAGSCLVVPATRSLITTRFGTDVPRALVLTVVLTSLVAPSVVFDDYETGTYFGTEEDVSVRVAYDGEWAGEIDGATSYRRIEGDGNRTVAVGDNDRTVAATVEKTDGVSGELTVSILIGEETVATDTAGAGERRVEAEYRIGLFHGD